MLRDMLILGVSLFVSSSLGTGPAISRALQGGAISGADLASAAISGVGLGVLAAWGWFWARLRKIRARTAHEVGQR